MFSLFVRLILYFLVDLSNPVIVSSSKPKPPLVFFFYAWLIYVFTSSGWKKIERTAARVIMPLYV